MSPYRLECTVCTSGFSSRKDWLQHFLEEGHQILAREECHQWLHDESVKECVVVAFATFPLASSSILNHFSKGTTIVTDFVWWKHRPKLGLLQFESRLKIDELLKNGSLITVDSQQVQLRRLSQYHQLEWDHLIPWPKCNVLETSICQNQTNDVSLNVHTTQSSNSISTLSPVLAVSSTDVDKIRTTQTSKQFADTIKQMEISPNYLNIARDVKAKLKQLCLEQFGPNIYYRASLFRHWYLGYKNNGKNELLIFVECRENPSPTATCLLCVNNDLRCKQLMRQPLAQQLFPNLVRAKLSKQNFSKTQCNQRVNLDQLGTAFEFTATYQRPIQFILMANPIIAPEVYTCRLLKHMCKFDLRVKPLIYLVGYWAKVNNITLAIFTQASIKGATYSPEPALLEWLIVFFCCVKRILPTPRYLKEQPHLPAVFNGIDVGFSSDQDFVNEWTSAKPSPSSSELPQDVCQLAQEFFSFFSELSSEPCILNMRDGEVISEIAFTAQFSKPPSEWNTGKFTKEEVITWKAMMTYSSSSPITIFHPLVDRQMFSLDREKFANQIRSMMMITATQLKTYCENIPELSSDTEVKKRNYTLKNALHAIFKFNKYK